MSNSKQIVNRYLQALHATKDLDAARACLHDDLRFEGPIDKFDRADDLIAALGKLSQIVKEANIRKMVVDGDTVCAVYDLVTNTPIGTSRVAEVFDVRDGKISAVEVYFDARPFAAMFEKGH